VSKPLLEQVDKNLPALNYAVSLQQVAAKVGFDWADINGVISKIHEELDEVTAELNKDDNQQRLLDEVGDLMFACTNLARHLNVDPQQALHHGNQKFYRRFSAVERQVQSSKKTFQDYTLAELDAFWDTVKQQETTPSKSL